MTDNEKIKQIINAMPENNMGRLADELNENSHAMRALAMLIRDSELNWFAADSNYSEGNCSPDDLKWGIDVIVELILKNQTEIIEKHEKNHGDTDYDKLRNVMSNIEKAKQGVYGDIVSIDILKEKIEICDDVSKNNDLLREVAEDIKKECVDLIALFNEKQKQRSKASGVRKNHRKAE